MIRVQIPGYGRGVLIRLPDHHGAIVRLDSGKIVCVEFHDCEVVS